MWRSAPSESLHRIAPSGGTWPVGGPLLRNCFWRARALPQRDAAQTALTLLWNFGLVPSPESEFHGAPFRARARALRGTGIGAGADAGSRCRAAPTSRTRIVWARNDAERAATFLFDHVHRTVGEVEHCVERWGRIRPRYQSDAGRYGPALGLERCVNSRLKAFEDEQRGSPVGLRHQNRKLVAT